MAQQQFVGQTLGRSSNVGSLHFVNLFPHITQDQRVVVFGTPGLSSYKTVGSGPIRGMYAVGTTLYVISRNNLYSIDVAGTVALLGTISTFVGAVSVANNPTQLMIVDGAFGYILTFATGVLAAIASANFPNGATTVTFIDGYFVVNVPNSGKEQHSALYDGTSWNALDFNTAEFSSDNLVAVRSAFSHLYLFGTLTTEIWYNAGDPDTVFKRAQVIETGCMAPFSIAKVGESASELLWLASSFQGAGFVVRSNGGVQVQRVSTPEVEYLWSQYSTIADARAYGYTQEGHIFYVINFPAAGKTWVYDLNVGTWHQRSSNGGQHLGLTYAFANNQHLVGSYIGGDIYSIGMDVYTDAGNPIIRELTTPTLGSDEGLISYQSMQIDMERGVGLPSGQGSDPQVMLSWSNDGGHAYVPEVMGGIGKQGDYSLRVIFRRLGRAFRRTWKIRVSDPIKIVIISATLKTE